MLGRIIEKPAFGGALIVAFALAALPASAAAQGYGYDRPASVVVQCGPGQRAVMETRANGRTEVVARCVGQSSRSVVDDDYGRPIRRTAYETYRPAERSRLYYQESPRRRSTSKTVLGIAGSAATGAGIGGLVKGKKGALVGAAIGGGAASIYEAAKRR